MVLTTPAVYLKFRIPFFKHKRDGYKLVLVIAVAVAIVARHHNVRTTNIYLGPSTVYNSINAE
jgi:hypothetical protein